MQKKLVRIFLVIGLAIFVILLVRLDSSEILDLLRGVGWSFFFLILLGGLYQLMRAGALYFCLIEKAGYSFGDLLWIRIMGEAISVLTIGGPILSEPSKAWLLKRRGLSTEEAFALTITEYLIYTLSSAALSALGLYWLARRFELGPATERAVMITAWGLAVFVLVGLVAIVFRIYLIGSIIRGLAALPGLRGILGPKLAGIRRWEDLLFVVLRDRPRQLMVVLVFETASQALLVLENYWVLKTMGQSDLWRNSFLFEATGKAVRFLFFFIPSQVGVFEGGLAWAAGVIGLATTVGFTLALVRRLRQMVVAAAGLAYAWITLRFD